MCSRAHPTLRQGVAHAADTRLDLAPPQPLLAGAQRALKRIGRNGQRRLCVHQHLPPMQQEACIQREHAHHSSCTPLELDSCSQVGRSTSVTGLRSDSCDSYGFLPRWLRQQAAVARLGRYTTDMFRACTWLTEVLRDCQPKRGPLIAAHLTAPFTPEQLRIAPMHAMSCPCRQSQSTGEKRGMCSGIKPIAMPIQFHNSCNHWLLARQHVSVYDQGLQVAQATGRFALADSRLLSPCGVCLQAMRCSLPRGLVCSSPACASPRTPLLWG
jgi:hypothetical protein